MKFRKYFFRAHRTNDLTKKLEKVGPFECDELEKHCRVSASFFFIALRSSTSGPGPRTLDPVRGRVGALEALPRAARGVRRVDLRNRVCPPKYHRFDEVEIGFANFLSLLAFKTFKRVYRQF